jgi:hypothetical protein
MPPFPGLLPAKHQDILSFLLYSYPLLLKAELGKKWKEKWVSYFSGFEKGNCHLVGVC